MQKFETDHASQFRNGITKLMLVSVILCSVFVSSIPVDAHVQDDRSELVYCPLQKKWVKPNSPSPSVKKKEPLAAICAPAESKGTFLFELSSLPRLNYAKMHSGDDEDIFFDFLRDSKQAMAELGKHRGQRNCALLKLAVLTRGSTANDNPDFNHARTIPASTHQLPRPPTTERRTNFIEISLVRAIETISRNINPRSPPRVV